MRIVLIDDHDKHRVRLSKTLEQEGHDIVSENSGRLGLRRLRQRRPDALITEILMPAMDGLEIIKAARQMYPDLWIIAMSGGGRLVSADLALTLARAFGADRILYRPFPKKDMLDAIQRR